MIELLICASDIPEEKVWKSKQTGKKYFRITAVEMKQPDKYGNTHTAYMTQNQNEREAGCSKVYGGKGKKFDFKK